MPQLIYTGTAAPSTAPAGEGYIFVDTTNDRVYLATGTSNSSDWKILPENIGDVSINADMDFGGAYKAINLKGLDFQTFAESTIATGVIAPTQTLVSVDTEGDASTDNIDTITVATDLNMICLKMENASRVPTLKHGTGNLSLPNGSDVAMVNDLLYWFIYDGSNWLLSFDPAGTAATFPIADGTTLLQGSIDSTKKVRFEVDTNTPTATTRVISTPSVDLDMDDIVINSGTGTDNAIPRFNADGQTVQDSNVLIDDSDNISGVAKISTTDHLELTEIAAPSTPATGKVAVYTKTDGKLYIKDDAGTETDCTGSGGGLTDVVDDTTPQLGGNLDVNGNKIVSVSNGDIDIEPNGTGNVLLGNFTFDADQTVGAGQDNYVMTYDNGSGLISLEASAGGSSLPVADTTSIVEGSVDATKEMRIEVDGLTTATVRVATMPDKDITLGTDDDAIHDNVAGEIVAITEKTSIAALDEYLTEDSADSNNKKSVKHKTIRQAVPQTQTGTTYTLAIDDLDLTMNNASANTVTIPTNASVAFPVNTAITVIQLGAGSTTVTGDTGVTVNGVSAGSVSIGTQYGGLSLIKTGTDTWVATVGSTGDVVGPASSTDNAIARFDSTTGKLIQNSSVTVDDNGKIDTGTEVAIGTSAGATSQGTNAVAVGNQAGEASQGANAVAIGYQAGRTSQTTNTVAIGYQAGQSSLGVSCTAIGYRALTAATGAYNTSLGYDAGRLITSGSQNSILGAFALDSNLTGTDNTAIGYATLSSATGSSNSASGSQSLFALSTGVNNTSSGFASLRDLTTGSNNSAIGRMAGRYISGGVTANQTSGTSCYIGADTKASADGNSNEIVIGYDTTGNGSNTVTLGNTSITETHIQGALAIDDGITAPSTITGKASIYVDSSDGDLKIKFSDGTIKTIVVDT